MNAGTTWLPTKPLAPVTRILDTACSPYVIAQGSTFSSGEHPLLNPVAQLVHICLRPRPVAGHRALPKSPEDRRGVRLDISVAPEVEPPLHRPTIGFPKQRPYVSLETQRHSVPPSDTISRAPFKGSEHRIGIRAGPEAELDPACARRPGSAKLQAVVQSQRRCPNLRAARSKVLTSPPAAIPSAREAPRRPEVG